MPMLTTLRIGFPDAPVHRAAPHAVRERRHAVEHLVHLRDDVDAVDLDADAPRRAAQRAGRPGPR